MDEQMTKGDEVNIQRSSRRAGLVWVFFDDVPDVPNLGPAEEKQEAWEAVIDGEVVGMAVVDTIPQSHAFVSRVAVVKEKRGMGVASALLERLKEEHGELACRVKTNNQGGMELVESVGFSRVESRFHDMYRYETSTGDSS